MMDQFKIHFSRHFIYSLLRAVVIGPENLSGDEGISGEQQCEHVCVRSKCAKDLHDYSLGSYSHCNEMFFVIGSNSCWCW